MSGRGRRARVFTLPPTLSFADTLAASLLARAEAPVELARTRILLPNRRSVRALAEAFLRVRDGAPLLMPRLSAAGDVDDDEIAFFGDAGDALDLPPAIDPTRRVFLLTRLVRRHPLMRGKSPAGAFRLAAELARLIDSIHTEGLDVADLAALAPGELASHWQVTLDFLAILTRHWPDLLAAEGALDPADRRNRLLRALTDRWSAQPPDFPVIAAGTTGSIPATADLLGVVARLPNGAVILPGFDLAMDEDSRCAAGETHPQTMMLRLLERIGVSPHEVEAWPLAGGQEAAASARSARMDLLRTAFRPAGLPEPGPAQGAVAIPDGLRRIDCPDMREEAGVIALLMREALEVPGRTAALVTPDRGLAREVRAALARWHIDVDDSAGMPAGQSLAGSFLRLLCDALPDCSPVALLALLKHPLAGGGLEPGALRALARRLDRFGGREGQALRGPVPAPGMDSLLAMLRAVGVPEAPVVRLAAVFDLLRPLAAALASPGLPVGEILRCHLAGAEALAATSATGGAERLWSGEAGAALAKFLADAVLSADLAGEIEGAAWPALFDALIAPLAVRPHYGRHPRLAILGTLEARLVHADLMILGGLNEETWPPAPTHDPWMSRPMRERFGLPPASRRTGQAAHDFWMAAGAAEVVLTRSQKRDGTPTVPSRWLSRLEVLAGKAIRGGERYLAMLHGLDRPDRVTPMSPPRPTPPVADRPDRLSVTEVETWMRDPYAIYAKKILDLRPLEPLEDDPGALRHGQVLHVALDRFVRDRPAGEDRAAARARLLACGREAFGALLGRPGIRAFWWPRFEAIADKFLDLEEARRGQFLTLATEVRGETTIPGEHPFTLVAIADRIDRNLADRTLEIIDYKTGTPPSGKRVEAGFAPQLPLEAWMASAGAFADLEAAPVSGLAFWRLRGTGEVIEIRHIGDVERQAAAAAAGLVRLVERFAREATPWLSNPRPREAGYGDYDHLARVDEWTRLPTLDEDEDGGGAHER